MAAFFNQTMFSHSICNVILSMVTSEWTNVFSVKNFAVQTHKPKSNTSRKYKKNLQQTSNPVKKTLCTTKHWCISWLYKTKWTQCRWLNQTLWWRSSKKTSELKLRSKHNNNQSLRLNLKRARTSRRLSGSALKGVRSHTERSKRKSRTYLTRLHRTSRTIRKSKTNLTWLHLRMRMLTLKCMRMLSRILRVSQSLFWSTLLCSTTDLARASQFLCLKGMGWGC